jgi:uncharacterized protein (TIGR00255 family)
MTGYGRGEARAHGNRVQVDVSAVNSRKQADLRVTMPRELSPLEPFLRRAAQKRLARGSVTISVSYDLSTEMRKGLIRIDVDLASHLAADLKTLARKLGIADTMAIGDLLQLPGVVSEDLASPCDPLRDLALEALEQAIDGLRAMQETEGAELKKDLVARCNDLIELTRRIEQRKDQVLISQRDRLIERIRTLGVEELAVDDERLAKEVAYYAERSDITEEIVRLHSHLKQFEDALQQDEEIGRSLDFLCQEMNREVTTICSKTADTESAQIALEIKNEIGRVREQVMNVE